MGQSIKNNGWFACAGDKLCENIVCKESVTINKEEVEVRYVPKFLSSYRREFEHETRSRNTAQIGGKE